jgi:CheY-like chemotaxis protein
MTKNNTTSDRDINNRILLVDDELDITTAFTLVLEDNGFKVDTFNDPMKALSSFRGGSYDLALLDYKMPNMNGFELYQKIRKIDDKIKVCFITAFEIYHEGLKKKFQSSSNESSQHTREEIDVKCIIKKPIDIEELVKRIKEELNS